MYRAVKRVSVAACAIATLAAGAAHSAAASPKPRLSREERIGFSFPKAMGQFRRDGGVKRDAGGNPTATYRAGRLVLLDMYLYRDRLPFASEFASCADYVKLVHPDARLTSDQVSRLHGTGRRAVFMITGPFLGGAKTKILSELIMYPQGDRFLKFRASYPAAHAARARAEIDSFIRALPR